MPKKKAQHHKYVVIPWYKVYEELNTFLMDFYIKNQENSGKKLYRLCVSDEQFVARNQWIRKFDSEFGVLSLDPIHIYSSINGSGQSDENRIKKINAFLKAIGVGKNYQHVDFTGCPSPFFVKMVGARNEKSQIEIWQTFYRVVLSKQQALNQRVFNKIKNWFGVEVSSFTIFLFWISSDNFLPLDKNTTELLKTFKILSKKPSTYENYKKMLPKESSPLYREIAKSAFDFKSNPENAKVLLKTVSQFFNVETTSQLNISNFRILAIRPLKGISAKFRKVLIEDVIYPFYSCFNFSNLTEIGYDPSKDVKIYDIRDGDYNLDINISAIVGRNGAGKSSITELTYLILNNFSKTILKEGCELEPQNGIRAELYYYLDTIYKLEVYDDIVNVWKYERKENNFINPTMVFFNEDDLSNLFYSIAVNYSHFSLNSKEIGEWIAALFHKNDGYEIPLVINPMRTEGNIDVNVEKSLVISRLLVNILEPVSSEPETVNPRQITENGRSAKALKLSIDDRKAILHPENLSLQNEDTQKKVINAIYRVFKIPKNTDPAVRSIADMYLFKKLNAIVHTYSNYKAFSDAASSIDLKKLNKLLAKIEEDKSHKTFKIKQAINFLRYDHLKFHDYEKPIQVGNLSDKIQKVIQDNPRIDLRTILLIPPSFFKVEILLDDESSFEHLSSGEKQRIHIVSSIAYHLSNLDSVSPEVIKYSYVNIIFDEIELYFHPEMQRSFISYLIGYLRKIKFTDLYGLNFCFVTHSPFILSDIPSNNILFLKANSKPVKDTEKLKTFGANIHDLLSDSFFLDKGFIGKFAEQSINEVIRWTNNKKSDISNKEQMRSIIDIIDDPIIKVKLVEMYAEKLGENMELAQLRAQQDYIANRLKQLEQHD
jgi:predicted ATP-binding protein involved in virulence